MAATLRTGVSYAAALSGNAETAEQNNGGFDDINLNDNTDTGIVAGICHIFVQWHFFGHTPVVLIVHNECICILKTQTALCKAQFSGPFY